MRLGVLTGGGDCPGLNAAIRAVVRRGVRGHGIEFVGFLDGWKGVLDDECDPLGVPDAPSEGPGAVRLAAEPRDAPVLQTIELAVRSESRRAIRVSSHFPFDRVNQRLVFDREAARGFRLDVEAGESVRWAPGQERTVRLVRFGGAGGER